MRVSKAVLGTTRKAGYDVDRESRWRMFASILKSEADKLALNMRRGWYATPVSIIMSIDFAYVALLVLMGLDLLSGTISAAIRGELSSSRNRLGVYRKTLAMVVVVSVHVFSKAAKLPVDLGVAVAMAFCVSELLSILENCVEAGLKLPRKVVRVIKALDNGWAGE